MDGLMKDSSYIYCHRILSSSTFSPNLANMFSSDQLPFMSPSPMNAASLTSRYMPADRRVFLSRRLLFPTSATPHKLSCANMLKRSFPVRSTEPASLVSMQGRRWPCSRKKRASAATTAKQDERVVAEDEEEDGRGLRIVDFLRDRNLFITGATGFVGKLLLEKILRSQPEVGRIFLLIQGPSQEAVDKRLKEEIIDAELFKRLREMHGNSYSAFMLSKLVPVVGHLEEDSLGMEEKMAEDVQNHVDVIVSCAANTRFDERYDIAINTNTNGASRLLMLAKRCRKLRVFLHVSTAYVNGARTGLIKERPFSFGDSPAREKAIATHTEELPPFLDIGAEAKMIKESVKGLEENMATPIMKELGLERARMHGWPNVYSFTKAMGEMMIGTMSDNIPTVIVRPTVIGTTIRDPFPGWIQGLRMVDPIIVNYGKGRLNLFTGDAETIVDSVPADMVVNALLAAIARHGSSVAGGLTVYHIGSSSVNPLRLDELFDHCYEHFLSFPLIDSRGKTTHLERIKLFHTLADLASHLSAADETNGAKGAHKILKKLSTTYTPYTTYKGRFDITKAQELMEKMSREEKRNFTFDMTAIGWRDYIVDVHIHGLRKHAIRGSSSNV